MKSFWITDFSRTSWLVLLENFENLWQEQQGKRQLTNQSIRIYSNKNQLKSSYFLIKLASIIKTALNV